MTLYNYKGDSKTDEYGVDHSGFSIRDELEYNFMRQEEKEKRERMQSLQNQGPVHQILGATANMVNEYHKMKNHGYKYMDDYHHCKANYDAASRGTQGEYTARVLGSAKEYFDYYRNRFLREMSKDEAQADYNHDMLVNKRGRQLARSGIYSSSMDACAGYRGKNPSFPEKYW